MKIALRPLGKIDERILEELKDRLNPIFGCPVVVKPGVNGVELAYEPRRKQYLSPVLLGELDALGKEDGEKVLGVADVDLCVPDLNFIFGEADPVLDIAIISLYRLRPEFYGLPPDESRLMERALKEMVHELGHTFGLLHCSNLKCVMHFSNCLADTDLKEATFCDQCRPRLRI